jgi:DNA-binding CsgD family transcriptional regulator
MAHVARPRVAQRLRAASAYRVTVVVAGAGFGKTTAVRQLIGDEPGAVFFLVPHSAVSLEAFLRAFAHSLADRVPSFAATVDQALIWAESANEPIEALVAWATEHLRGLDGPIVIDDLHHTDIAEPGRVARFLGLLIDRLAGGPRWVFISRTAGALPTTEWTLYGDADDPIEPADLTMDVAEATALAAETGSALTAAEIGHLVAFTGGWPFLLAYAIRSSRRVVDLDRIEQLTRELTFRYLAEQLWAELDAGERQLLLYAAVLAEVRLDDELPGVGNVRRPLQRLARTMPFLNVTASAFRLHDLLREFARTQFLALPASARCDVLTESSRVLERRGALREAIRTLIEAGDAPRVHAFAERHFTTLMEDAYIGECEAILAAFPFADPALAPDVQLAIAIRIALVRRAHDRVVAEVEELLRRPAAWAHRFYALSAAWNSALINGNGGFFLPQIHASLDADPPPLVHAFLLACRSTINAHSGNVPAAHEDLLAAVLLAGSMESVEHARVVNIIAMAYEACGDLEAAIREIRRAAAYCEEHATWQLAAAMRINETIIAILASRHDVFVQASERAIAASRAAGNWAASRTAHQLVAYVQAISNRSDTAEVVAIADPAPTLASIRNVLVLAEVCKAIVAMSRGDAEGGYLLLGRRGDWANYTYVVAHLRALAAAMMGRGAAKELAAARILQKTPAAAAAAAHGGFPRYLPIATQLALGRWHAAHSAMRELDRPPEAFTDLHEAMRSMSEGPPFTGVRPTLERAADAPFAGFLASVLLRTLDRVRDPDDSQSSIVLTAAESAVLLLLEDGCSYQEIAARRGSSLSTVKAQASAVFRKLGTPGNRVRALREARRRGLLR